MHGQFTDNTHTRWDGDTDTHPYSCTWLHFNKNSIRFEVGVLIGFLLGIEMGQPCGPSSYSSSLSRCDDHLRAIGAWLAFQSIATSAPPTFLSPSLHIPHFPSRINKNKSKCHSAACFFQVWGPAALNLPLQNPKKKAWKTVNDFVDSKIHWKFNLPTNSIY